MTEKYMYENQQKCLISNASEASFTESPFFVYKTGQDLVKVSCRMRRTLANQNVAKRLWLRSQYCIMRLFE